jgi:hypothetical protein
MGNINYRIAEDGTIIRDGGIGASSNPEPPKKSKTRLIVLLLLLVVGGGASIGYYFGNQNSTEQASPTEQAPPYNNPVEVIVSDFPNERRIKDFINDYYSIFANNEYYKLDNYFAEMVPRYYKKTNVTRSEIKEGYIKYHERTLRVKSISYSVRWNTFEQTKISNDVVSVSFILDYYLNTERFGNQKYVLKIKKDINSNYKIVGISEDIIERQNL